MQTSFKLETTSFPSSPSKQTETMVAPMAKGLRSHQDPDQDESLVHCPRCDSTNTKFCYYNNYSLRQPRYFCKSCRRYWTKGGTIRNIPIGGVSRKSKKLYQKYRREEQQSQPEMDGNVTRVSYPESNELANSSEALFSKYPDFTLENLTIDFMESGRGSSDIGEYEGGDNFSRMMATQVYDPDTGNTHGLAPFGEMMSYYRDYYEKMINVDDVKPKLFDMERRDQNGCFSDLHGSGGVENGSSGSLTGLGSSWSGLLDGYGLSSTNPLV